MIAVHNIRQWLRGCMVTTASLTLSLGIITTAVAAELPPEETYSITFLSIFDARATDMNEHGVTTGGATTPGSGDDYPRAVIWDETGAFTDLHPDYLNGTSVAMGINNHGDVVGKFQGYINQPRGPVQFADGNVIPLLDPNGVQDPDGTAGDINDHGLIVGCSNDIPVVWDNSDIATPIPGIPEGATGCATTANNLGDIVGYVTVNNITHAALWSGGQMIDLGALPGHEYSIAFGINESGQVVGFSRDMDGSKEQLPFLWDNGVLTNLGTISGNQGIAYDINDQGHIVGGAPLPFLYRNGVMYDLSPLGSSLRGAIAINESGQIAGFNYVLTPAPNQLDMAVSLSAPTGPIDSGTVYDYNITVTNRSTVDGLGVQLNNSLTSELQVISATSDQGSCSTTAPVICELGTVAAGSSVNIVLTVKPEVPFSTSGNLVYVSNYAQLSSSNTDVNGANNSAYQSTSVTPPPAPPGADLAVSLTDAPDPVRKGSDMTYTAIVVNNGPETAVNILYTQSIQARFKLKSITTTHGECSGGSSITCDLGDLAANETVTIVVEIRPNFPRGTSFFSTATVKSDIYDPAGYNNSTSVMTSIR